MGAPKGLTTLSGDPRPLCRRIVELYAGRRWALQLVTLPDLADRYAAALAETDTASVTGSPAGGDTARTVVAGWRALQARGSAPTHLWIHPVDLPLVSPRTIDELLAHSERRSDAVLRPQYRAQPGHPLVLPVLRLGALDLGDTPDGAMRDMLRGVDVTDVSLDDGGIVHDFDSTNDLAKWTRGAADRRKDDTDGD